MAEIVRLEIRGVGGATAEEILGGPTTQVSGDRIAWFAKPVDEPENASERVEAYEWGRLTSGASTTAIWWLLLPFTLINVAGWMFIPSERERNGGGGMAPHMSSLWLARGFVVVGGVAMTVIYTLWIVALATDMVAFGCAADEACNARWYTAPVMWFDAGEAWLVTLGIGLCGLLMLGLFYFILRTQDHLEGYERDDDRRLIAMAQFTKEPGRLSRNTQLDDQDFWYKWAEHRRLFRWHLGTTMVIIGGAAGHALYRTRPEWPTGWAPVAIVVVVALLVGMVWLLSGREKFRGALPETEDERVAERAGKANKQLRWTLAHVAFAVAGGLGGWLLSSVLSADGQGFRFLDAIRYVTFGLYVVGALFIQVLIHRRFGKNPDGTKSRRRFWRMVGTEVAVVAAVAVLVAVGRGWHPAAGWIGAIAAIVVAALVVRRRCIERGWSCSIIWLMPGVAAALALTIAGAGFAAIAHVLGRVLVGSDWVRDNGYDIVITDIVVIGLVITAAIVAIWYWRADKPTDAVTELYFDGPSARLDDREKAWVKAVAAARSRAEIPARADLVLTLMVLVFLVLAVAQLAVGNFDFSAGPGGAFAAPLFGVSVLNAVHTASSAAIVLYLFPGLLLIRGSARSRTTRRQYGKVWDVLSFWPRRYHPLAAPCYAERAVPEFRDRIRYHLSEKRKVIVSAHSQGTIIAFAALAQIASEFDEDIDLAPQQPSEPAAPDQPPAPELKSYHDMTVQSKQAYEQRTAPHDAAPAGAGPVDAESVDADIFDGDPVDAAAHVTQAPMVLGEHDMQSLALVTFGSPLMSLYGPYFRWHFGGAGRLNAVRAKLAQDATGRLCWVNLYRLTDYIGRQIFIDPGGVLTPDDADADVLVQECLEPLFPHQSHSNYEREAQLRETVDAFRTALTGG